VPTSTEIALRAAVGLFLVGVGLLSCYWSSHTATDLLAVGLAAAGGLSLGVALILTRQRLGAQITNRSTV
jgi:hypothetical protein